MIRPKVAYWNSQPTPYMVDRWNEVARRGNLDLYAWFNMEREPDRSWEVDPASWIFKGSYLRPTVLLGRDLYLPIRELSETNPDVVIQEYNSASYLAGLALARSVSQRVAFRALPTYDSWVTRTKFKEFVKQFAFRSVDGVKTSGNDGQRQFARYGINPNRITPVTQAVALDRFVPPDDVSDARNALREKCGNYDVLFLYVGRILEKKGIFDLLEAFRSVRNVLPEASLLVVGDGADQERFRAQAAKVGGVTLEGFIQQRDLPRVYWGADVFVFPTHGDPNGLVVEEAMAAGLPIISSSAAGDIERRLGYETAGFVVPPKDAMALADRMVLLGSDSVLRNTLSRSARELASRRSLDRYAYEFEEFVFSLLEHRRRYNPVAMAVNGIGWTSWKCIKLFEN